MKRIKGAKGASHEAEESREQRDVSVYRFENVIKEERHSDIARGRKEVGHNPAAYGEHSYYSRYKGEQVKDAGDSGLETR